jgi:hypothetical protein
MNTLTLELPNALDELLTSVAKGRRTSKVEIALQALQEYLARQDKITKEYLENYLDRHGAPAPESFAARAAHLIGSIDVDGPTDLSTNKKYFDGFGK